MMKFRLLLLRLASVASIGALDGYYLALTLRCTQHDHADMQSTRGLSC